MLNFVNRALENINLKKENKTLENKLFHSFELMGDSNQIIKIKKMISKLSSTESRILIYGPTGSGKELVARKIHKNSPRAKQPFVVLNGASLQPDNYEYELFNRSSGIKSLFFISGRKKMYKKIIDYCIDNNLSI